MFALPVLDEIITSREYVQEFRGYNHNMRPDDGQFYDMKNISTDYYPIFAPRTERGIVSHLSNCQGFLGADRLAYVDDGWFYYNGNQKIRLGDTENERTMVRMGAYICIFPDKIVYNTDDDSWEPMEAYWDSSKINYQSQLPVNNLPAMMAYLMQVWDAQQLLYISGFIPEDLVESRMYDTLYFYPTDPDDIFGTGPITCETISHAFDDTTNTFEYYQTKDEIAERLKSFLEYYMPHIRLGYFTPQDYTEPGFIERVGLKYNLCTHDGELYQNVTGSTTAPADTTATWVDTSTSPYTVKIYGDSQWILVPTVYVRIEEAEAVTGSYKHINEVFDVGDTVHISGSIDDQFNADMQIQSQGMNDGKGWIVVIGIIDQELTQNQLLYITRTVPAMDFITEHNNRLWGCSSANHEIYASKLGDPKNWYAYTGISTDSYAATIGSAGEFTGVTSHMGYVLFFKDNMIIRIYGTMPANFTLSEIVCRGVQPGCEKSLVILNETLFYKSQEGVCVYDGSLPTCISASLGTGVFTDAVAGQYNNKYYICMKDEAERWNVFVYDYNKGLWAREDDTHIRWFANVSGTLYYVNSEHEIVCVDSAKISSAFYPGSAMTQKAGDETSDGTHIYPLSTLYPGQNADLDIEQDISWMAETGEIGLTTPDNKYISKIQIRAKAEVGTVVYVDVKYDTEDQWSNVFEFEPNRLKSFLIPIRPKRCDSMKIKLHGTGRIKLYSIAKTLEEGSEL